jgi:hypothetical protein
VLAEINPTKNTRDCNRGGSQRYCRGHKKDGQESELSLFVLGGPVHRSILWPQRMDCKSMGHYEGSARKRIQRQESDEQFFSPGKKLLPVNQPFLAIKTPFLLAFSS